MSPTEALAALLDALPRCCSCEVAPGVIQNHDRWWLCAPCWWKVPCAREEPLTDLREVVRVAQEALGWPTPTG